MDEKIEVKAEFYNGRSAGYHCSQCSYFHMGTFKTGGLAKRKIRKSIKWHLFRIHNVDREAIEVNFVSTSEYAEHYAEWLIEHEPEVDLPERVKEHVQRDEVKENMSDSGRSYER